MLFGGLDDVPGAQDIVRERFFDAVFHQGHMFVCRGMKYNIGLVSIDQPAHAPRVAHIGDDLMDEQVREGEAQIQADFGNAVLTTAQQDDSFRTKSGNLPAELAPDGPDLPLAMAPNRFLTPSPV